MVAPKGRFQSRDGYVRSVEKIDARRMVQDEREVPFEPRNRAVPQDAEQVVTPVNRVVPTLPPPPVSTEEQEPRAGWLVRLWRRLLALMTGKR